MVPETRSYSALRCVRLLPKTAASLTAGSQTATSQTATASADNQSSVPVAPTAIPQATSIDTASILVSVGEVAYDWHIDTDALSWGTNVKDVLLIPDVAAAASGRAYAQILDADNAQARFDVIMQSDKRDDGHGVAYQIQYGLRPDPASETRLWVEDTGRWFVGADGKPARAHGLIRVINERYEHEQRLTFLARCDGLTGELNRHRLTEVLEDTLEEAMRFRSSCGFLLVAIDNLARINESYGFDVADEVINAVSKRVRSRMRGKDTLGPLFRQQIRLGLARLHARRHGGRCRAHVDRHPRRDGADIGGAGCGHRHYRRGDRTAPCQERDRSSRPRPGKPRRRQVAPPRLVPGLPPEHRARSHAPRSGARNR